MSRCHLLHPITISLRNLSECAGFVYRFIVVVVFPIMRIPEALKKIFVNTIECIRL